MLAISIAIQPVAIYFVAKTIQGNHPDQNKGKQVGNYTAKEEFAPIFYALCGELKNGLQIVDNDGDRKLSSN